MFERQLELIEDLTCIKRRVFSTWTDDYEKNADHLKRLSRKFGLEIVHRSQPPFVSGNFLHQMTALDHGLSQLSAHDIVCKSRTDIVFERSALQYVICKDRQLTAPGIVQDFLVDSRIDILEAQISCPFFYDDIAFCGRVSDLRRFVNMEMRFQLSYRCHSAVHERYWGNFFDNRIAFLSDYYRNSWIMGGDEGLKWVRLLGNDYRRAMTNFAIRDHDFGLMMALSYMVTHQMFSLDWGPTRPLFHFKGTHGEHVGTRWQSKAHDEFRTLRDVFAAEHFTKPDGAVSCNSDRFFERLVTGSYEDCEIGRNFRRCMREVSDVNFRDLQTLADMTAFSARAIAHSKTVIHEFLPRFRDQAHELARGGKVDHAEVLINHLMTHMAA